VLAVGKSPPKKPYDPDALPDDVIDFFARQILEGEGDQVPPLALPAMLRRLRELLPRRPAHRPRTDKAGPMVYALIEYKDVPPAEAKKRVAKRLGKKFKTVDTAYYRYLAWRRDVADRGSRILDRINR
jgi:hypothetical protein